MKERVADSNGRRFHNGHERLDCQHHQLRSPVRGMVAQSRKSAGSETTTNLGETEEIADPVQREDRFDPLGATGDFVLKRLKRLTLSTSGRPFGRIEDLSRKRTASSFPAWTENSPTSPVSMAAGSSIIGFSSA